MERGDDRARRKSDRSASACSTRSITARRTGCRWTSAARRSPACMRAASPQLRDHYGLEKRLVKVCEPYQMLGLIEDDLNEAIGIDVAPLISRTNMFGFENRDWKPWTFNGLEVLVPEDFRTTIEPEKGGTLIYPKGDTSARPSGHMPKDGYFFDSIIRQKPIDLEQSRSGRQHRAVHAADRPAARRDRGGRARGQHGRIRGLRLARSTPRSATSPSFPAPTSPTPRACATSPNGTC